MCSKRVLSPAFIFTLRIYFLSPLPYSMHLRPQSSVLRSLLHLYLELALQKFDTKFNNIVLLWRLGRLGTMEQITINLAWPNEGAHRANSGRREIELDLQSICHWDGQNMTRVRLR